MKGHKKWMVKINTGPDLSQAAQFIKEYTFTAATAEDQVIGTKLRDGQLKLKAERTSPPDTFIPNTFEYIFYNSDGTTRMNIHLDERNVFQAGHVRHMKVGTLNLQKEENKLPQFLEIFEVPGSETTIENLIGKPANVKQVGATVDNSLDPALKDQIYMGTWKRKYYRPNQVNK